MDPNAGTSASGQRWFWIPQEVGDQKEQSSNSNGSNVESVNLSCDVGKVAKNVSTSGVCWQRSASLSSVKAVESLKKRSETWKVAHGWFHYQIKSINLIPYLSTCYDCHECIFEWSDKWWRLSVASVDTETTKIAFLECSCTLSPRLFGPGTNCCKCATLKQPLPLKSSWHWNYDACETWGRNSELRKLGLTNLANKLDVPSTSIDSGVVPAHVSIFFQKGGSQLEAYREYELSQFERCSDSCRAWS